MKKILGLLSTLMLSGTSAISVISCQQKQTFLFGGSTSVQGLMNSVLKKFNQEHNIRIAYNSSGSSGGETGIKNNTLVFGFTSRALKTEFTKDPYAGLKFAVDGILLIANLPSDCQGSNLELDLISSKVDVLKSIYEGETKIWGNLLECQSTTNVTPINREQNSGTRDVFQEKLQIKEFDSQLRTANNTAAAIKEVKDNSGSIGYVSYSAKKLVEENKLSILKYKGIVASPTTLQENYELKRYFELTFHLKGDNLSLVKNFLLFLKNEAKGQSNIQADELIPAWEWYGTNPFSDLFTLD
ncbi:substrate-binding domain-containing protein [Spiroplasma endosymbiont of Seladonia tumulorum]|uniref:substrate-binding domain-containing protein n=1 Tax=Spiroplasma endosymbiont of Seladonia tumulorum TaxID=3066321 RepID=UPI0030D52B6F